MVRIASILLVCAIAVGCGSPTQPPPPAPPRSEPSPLPSITLNVIRPGTLECSGSGASVLWTSKDVLVNGPNVVCTAADSNKKPIARCAATMPLPEGRTVEVKVDLEVNQRVLFRAGEGLTSVTLTNCAQVLGKADAAVATEFEPGQYTLLLKGELAPPSPAEAREVLLWKALAAMARGGQVLANLNDQGSATQAISILERESKHLSDLQQQFRDGRSPARLDEASQARVAKLLIGCNLQLGNGYGHSNTILEDGALPADLGKRLKAARDEFQLREKATMKEVQKAVRE